MALSINNLLLKLSSEYYINEDSQEAKKINASVQHLKSKLEVEFSDILVDIIPFGSYQRGTILPRKYDENSDVDIMIVFNHSDINVRPITYRKYLQDFSDLHYPNSLSFKSAPAVVLELNHIKYDLVPAYISEFLSSKTIYIPETDSDWISTDPHGFSNKITEKNKNNSNMIKPAIRLMKAWNAKVGYPITSYELEKMIVNDFYVFPSTLEEYFFNIIYWFSSDGLATASKKKIKSLKENAVKVRNALSDDKEKKALTWLAHILPI